MTWIKVNHQTVGDVAPANICHVTTVKFSKIPQMHVRNSTHFKFWFHLILYQSSAEHFYRSCSHSFSSRWSESPPLAYCYTYKILYQGVWRILLYALLDRNKYNCKHGLKVIKSAIFCYIWSYKRVNWCLLSFSWYADYALH